MSRNLTSRTLTQGKRSFASVRWAKPLVALILGALLWGSASAQYQYGYDPSAYMYGVDPNAWLYGAYGWYGQPLGYDMSGYMYGGYGGDLMGQMDLLLQQVQAGVDQSQQQFMEYQQQLNAQMEEYYRYFISVYRNTTGDMTSSDQVAFNYGYEIHCQQYPVDCQLAAQQSQARLADQRAAFDAHNASWYENQAAMSQANSDWINTAIWGVSDYSSGAGGAAYQLPYAPAPGETYQTPLGNPLVFDYSQNIWYQIGPDGSYTPFYSAP